jgi:Uma2 family endonuclease
MYQHADAFPPVPPTTQAAEGLPRRPWTVAEVEAMAAAGIIDEDERFELIGGEAVPMALKSGRHELVKIALNKCFQEGAPEDVTIGQGTTLRLDARTFLMPDFCAFPRSVFPGDLRGNHVALIVEIGDESLPFDLGGKLSIYLEFGIPEVWVIDANNLVTHVRRRLGPEGFAETFEAGPDEEIVSTGVPAIAMCLRRLGLKPGLIVRKSPRG